MVWIELPSILAAQAGGQKRFDVEAETVGEALRALPVADLIFTEVGEWSPHLNVFVDGEDARERGGIACSLAGVSSIRVVGMISGG